MTDSSISTQQHDLSFELVSPVLQGETGMSSMRRVMDSVRRIGIQTNASCGFHVHVDAEPDKSPIASLESLKNIAQWFVSLENAFDLLVALSWEQQPERDNHSILLRDEATIMNIANPTDWPLANDRIDNDGNVYHLFSPNVNLVHWMNPLGDRYRKVNLTNIVKQERPSTIEFRLHGGVQDVQQAEAWVRLLLLFCENAALGRNRFVVPCQKDRRRNQSSWHSLSYLIVMDWSNSLQSKKDYLQRIVLCKSGIVMSVDEYFTVAGRYLSTKKLVGTERSAQLLPSYCRPCIFLVQAPTVTLCNNLYI